MGGKRGLNVLKIAVDRGETITNHNELIFDNHLERKVVPAMTNT